MKSFLQNNNIEIYSMHNERKFAVAERFIRTITNRIYKYMTSVSKNMYIDKLDEIVNKYNYTYHGTIKIKPVNTKPNTYINSSWEINDKDPKFKIDDIVRISKYKNIFANGYGPNWSEEVFVIKKVKNAVPRTYVISDLNGEETAGTFYEKNSQQEIKKILELKK